MSNARKHQSSINTLEVYARIRKVCDSTEDSCILVTSDSMLKLQSLSKKVTQCHFAKVFDKNIGQKDLFFEIAKPMIENLFRKKNGLLFTYGVTNSGKTYTMTGTVKEPGLLPRSLDMIFGSIIDLQASKYRFIPDDMNGFDIQSEAEAMLQRQEKDYLPTLKGSKTLSKKHMSKDIQYAVEHCYTKNIDLDYRYSVFVSYVEIYNEHIFDLLADDLVDSCNRAKPLLTKRLREDKKKNMFVYGATQVEVESTEEAFAAFQQGQERRRIAHTQLNAMSSRSHSIFIIKLVQAPVDSLGEDLLADKRLISVSQLSLVDLAGSERLSRTSSKNDRLREAGNINNSLMALRTCLAQLRENQKNRGKELVKYRNSKLTHLFKSYFEGHGKIKMVLCLNPNIQEYEENLQVVQFAEIAQEVTVLQSQGDKNNQDLRSKVLRAKLDNEKQRCSSRTDSATTYSESSVYSDSEWEGVSYDAVGFPDFELLECNDTDTLPALIEYLGDRITSRNKASEVVLSMSNLFRRNVANGNLSNRDLRSRMMEVESELNANAKEVAKLERHVKKLESKNQVLTKTAQIFKMDKKQLCEKLSDVEIQLKNALLEKQQLKSKLPEAIEKTKTQVGRVYDRRIRVVRNELEEKIHAKNERLDQLRNILCNAENLRFDKNGHYVSSAVSSGFSQSSDSRHTCRRKSKTHENLFPEQKRSKISSLKTASCSNHSSETQVETTVVEKETFVDQTKPEMIDEHTSTIGFKLADKNVTTSALKMLDKRTSTAGPKMFDKRTITTGPRMIHEGTLAFRPVMVHEGTGTVNYTMVHEGTATTHPKMIDEKINTMAKKMVDEDTFTTPQLSNRQRSTDIGQGDMFLHSKEQENPRTLGCHYINRKDENNFRHRPAAPVAPKHRRACCASSDHWLAHCPDTTINPETILQPAIKPNRTVSVPSPKDVASANKYLLTHQCEDTDGELETQLVKGEVFHTRTGGQQVQFVDVETLKQSDPKKQSSGDSFRPARNCNNEKESDAQSSWTDVETRCAFGIGCANLPLRELSSDDEVK